MNCCNCICPRPRRPFITGPTGPTGPTGAPGSSLIAGFNQDTTGLISAQTPIPLFDIANLSSGNITHTSGSENVVLNTVGYYRISYNSTATPTAAGIVSLTVTANTNAIPASVTSETVSAGEIGNLSSSFIFNNTSPNTVLNLVNTSSGSTTFTDTNLIVEYLGS